MQAPLSTIARNSLYNAPKHTTPVELINLKSALQSGKIQFYRGSFKGKFTAPVSKELKSLGAKWSAKDQAWKLPSAELPPDLRMAISSSEVNFEQKLKSIDRRLEQILPEEIAEKLKVSEIFDRSLWKVDKEFHKNVAKITVAPQLTESGRQRIAEEWETNMQKYVKDFSETEISELRQKIQKTVYAGNRYESAVQSIQKSFGVSERKAKFLARQETALLMAKFKAVRYQDAGITKYKWKCVSGTATHPVRKWHKDLEDRSRKGETFSWDDPPITSKPGEPVRKNNPGEDYNCRCFAIPVVDFRVLKKGK